MNDVEKSALAAQQWEAVKPETREFFARLDEKDVVLLEQGIELVRASLTVSKFVKWFLLTVIGAFLGGIALWDAIIKIIGRIKGAS